MSSFGDLDHVDKEWRFQDVDLTSASSAPITISWSLTSDMSRELGGWTLDEVCVVGIGKRAVCGDRVVDDGEQCDGTDGCSASCTEDAGCCSAGTNPSGPLLLGLGVIALLVRRRR
jgi:MYXO-CTERM domain-containing protein